MLPFKGKSLLFKSLSLRRLYKCLVSQALASRPRKEGKSRRVLITII